MKKLRIGIIDLLDRAPVQSTYGRLFRASLAGIMPQVTGVWCRELGHDVFLAYYNGYESMLGEIPENPDVVFISSFTQSAHSAYALSRMFRAGGAVTVLGGPHARCYPVDAQKYFDYVLGFTDKKLIGELLDNPERQSPLGVCLSAEKQPRSLPGVEERWDFLEPLLRKASWLKVVPMIGSLGCPYDCGFCVDAAVPYQELDLETIKSDLRFLLTKFKKPRVGWHDPNFGVRFNDYLGAIEEAVPPRHIDFIAETTMSLLTEKNVKRLKKNNFIALIPGIESWFDLGKKSGSVEKTGAEKVRLLADQSNMILAHIPYLQSNFVLGMDCDQGPEAFDLTKRYLEKAPGSFPGFSLLTAFGHGAPLNLELQRLGRVIGVPFHFLDNTGAMNVLPKHFGWTEFYDRLIDLHEFAFSRPAVVKRWRANRGLIPRLINLFKALTFEGRGKIRYFKRVRGLLDTDTSFHSFFEGETAEIPRFFTEWVKKDLGPVWDWLAPDQDLTHDPNSFLKASESRQPCR